MYEQTVFEVEKGTALLKAKCQGTLDNGTIARRLSYYSTFMDPKFVRCSSTDNISGVIDALLRITTKVTDAYASDILFTIQKLQAAMKQGKPFSALLLFRESGVTERTAWFQPKTGTPYVVMHQQYKYKEMDAIQTWLLAYAPGDAENECFTLLRRVRVMAWQEGFLA